MNIKELIDSLQISALKSEYPNQKDSISERMEVKLTTHPYAKLVDILSIYPSDDGKELIIDIG